MSTTTASTGARHDLGEVDDRTEITDLVYRLGLCLDERRFDDIRHLAAEDATVRTPGGQAAGREALVAQAHRNHPPDQRHQHVITNVLIDLDGDRAEVRTNLVVHITEPDSAPAGVPAPAPVCSIGEVYRFGLARTQEGWRLTAIEAVPLWVSGTLPPTPAT
jgi:3-phenylpropionate/cinnamic acid dioxygenase small subunit